MQGILYWSGLVSFSLPVKELNAGENQAQWVASGDVSDIISQWKTIFKDGDTHKDPQGTWEDSLQSRGGTLKLVSLQEVQILRVLGVLEWGEGIFPCLGLVSFIKGKEADTLTTLGKCVLV